MLQAGKHLCAAAEQTSEQVLELSTFGFSCVLESDNSQNSVASCLRGVIRSLTCQQHHGCFVQGCTAALYHCTLWTVQAKAICMRYSLTTGSCLQVVLMYAIRTSTALQTCIPGSVRYSKLEWSCGCSYKSYGWIAIISLVPCPAPGTTDDFGPTCNVPVLDKLSKQSINTAQTVF